MIDGVGDVMIVVVVINVMMAKVTKVLVLVSAVKTGDHTHTFDSRLKRLCQ